MRGLLGVAVSLFNAPVRGMQAIVGASGAKWVARPEQERMRIINSAFVAMLAVACLFTTGPSVAFTTPAANSLGYDIYNLVVNELLSGPVGFVGAIMVITWGAFQVMKNWMITVATLICGTVVLKAQSIVTSLGYVASAHSSHAGLVLSALGLA